MSTMMSTINPHYVDELLHTVNGAAFPRHIAFRLASIDFDRCRIELDILPQHFQPFGIVHGGVFATLIDTATFWAGFMRLPQETGLVNIDLKLNYLKPGLSGKLIAEGRCLRAGKQVSYTEAYVRDESGELLAHGTSTLMALPGKGLKLAQAKFVG